MSNRRRRQRIQHGRLSSVATHLAGGPPPADGTRGREEICLVQAGALAGEGFDPATISNDGGDLGGGLIPNVAVLTIGTAYPLGRDPFEVDTETLRQTAEAINAAGGVSCRVTHPELQRGPGGGYVDGILFLVGRVQNARLAGGQVRADVHLGSYANHSPAGGQMGTYLLELARKSPRDIGMSMRSYYWFDDPAGGEGWPVGRVAAISAVDFVERPGGNPNGLLAGEATPRNTSIGRGEGSPGLNPHPGNGDPTMNKRLRQYLESIGLAAGATEAQATTHWQALTGSQREIADTLNLAGSPTPPPANTPPATPPAQTPAATPTNLAGGTPPAPATAEAIRAADDARRTAIIALASEHHLDATWAQGLCDRHVTLADAQHLVELARSSTPIRPPAGGSGVQVGEDRALAGLREAITDAICLRAGVNLYQTDSAGQISRGTDGRLTQRQPHERARQFMGLSLTRTAQEYLRCHNVGEVNLMSDRDILELALMGRAGRGDRAISLAMGTSDFAHVLGNVMHASIRAMYAEAEQEAIWPQWCGRVVLPDFRPSELVSVSEVPDLLLRHEGGETRYATFTDGHESVRVLMFSRGMRFTQQAQRNDSFGVFAKQIRSFAGAFVRLMDRLTTAILTANANMADGAALFVAAHRNIPNPDAALSIASLSAARTALRTQLGMRTAEDGDTGPAVLNLRVRTLMTAAAIEDTARVLLASEYDPAVGVGVANPVRNMATVIGNPYLDMAGATGAWYALADPSGPGGGVQAIFLQGEEAPEIRTTVDFETGDLKVICEAKGNAKADDHRGLYRGHA